MKIGLFMPTVNNGFIMSEAAPQYRPDFDYNKEVVQKAERYGMDFALSLVKYRGSAARPTTGTGRWTPSRRSRDSPRSPTTSS
jgi:alkanesulfonate monooxygenase SsuD/methylene tetrahydromethanopterin reductase-like flavin-dependent oxidoreductase (luciferase family)